MRGEVRGQVLSNNSERREPMFNLRFVDILLFNVLVAAYQ